MKNNIRLRLTSAILACALAAVASATFAQQKKPRAPKEKEPVVKERVVFAVNEGATTSVTHVELLQRYAGLANVMENALRRPVKVEVYPDTGRFRSELERQRQFDLVFGKTVNLLAGMIRDKKYQAIVKTKNPYVAGFITAKDS